MGSLQYDLEVFSHAQKKYLKTFLRISRPK